MGGKYYPKELKEEVINKIKSEGLTGVEASNRYGINVKNIYRWLSQGVGGGTHGQILENNRLKRENKQLKQIIGQLLFEKEKGKKN